jgi:hypothetical protein
VLAAAGWQLHHAADSSALGQFGRGFPRPNLDVLLRRTEVFASGKAVEGRIVDGRSAGPRDGSAGGHNCGNSCRVVTSTCRLGVVYRTPCSTSCPSTMVAV